MSEHKRIGEKIRKLREVRDLSVEELAEQCQCNPEVISQLETGHLVPSLAPLLKIARGLGVRLGTFLDDDPHSGAIITRTGHHESSVRFSGLGTSNLSTLDFFSLAPNKKDRHMEPFLVDIHPTVAEDCMLSSHEGEEFIYVLSGQIEVTYGKDIHILSADDSIYYDSVVPHEVRAAGETPARILAVIYTPM